MLPPSPQPTVKILKFGTPQTIAITVLKNRKVWCNIALMHPKDADGMANSEDPDQTASSEAVWSWSALFAETYLSQYIEFVRYAVIKATPPPPPPPHFFTKSNIILICQSQNLCRCSLYVSLFSSYHGLWGIFCSFSLLMTKCSNYSLLVNPFMTGGLVLPYHLDESICS